MPDKQTSENLFLEDDHLKNTSFGVDVFKLVSGTTVSLAFTIFAAPILTRFYSPSAFGLLAVFTSITTIITVISCLRYEYSIMLPESDEEAGNLLVGSVLISILISFLTVPVVWIGHAEIPRLINAPELGAFLWLIPLSVLLGGVTVGHPALNYWVTRTKHFGWLSIARIFGAVVTVVLQIAAGYFGYATGGSLILASVIGGGVVSTLILGWQIWIFDGKFLVNSFNWNKMRKGLKRHYKFPLFDNWAAFLNVISSQLPTFFLTTYFSPSVTGYYALGNRVLRLPMNLVGNSVSQVFFQRAAKAKANNTLVQVVESTFYFLVVFGMFPLLILAVIGKELFIVVFGPHWSEAGGFTQILSVWAFFMFISSPMSTLFRVLEKQEFSLKINIIIFISRFLSLLIGSLLGNSRVALLIFAGSGTVIYGYLSLTIMKKAGASLFKAVRVILHNVFLFLPFGIFLNAMRVLGLNSWLLVGFSAMILLIYYFFLIKNDSRFFGFFAAVLNFRTNESKDI